MSSFHIQYTGRFDATREKVHRLLKGRNLEDVMCDCVHCPMRQPGRPCVWPHSTCELGRTLNKRQTPEENH